MSREKTKLNRVAATRHGNCGFLPSALSSQRQQQTSVVDDANAQNPCFSGTFAECFIGNDFCFLLSVNLENLTLLSWNLNIIGLHI